MDESKKLNLPSLTIEEENILSAIDGAMDTSINLFSLRRGGLDLNGSNPFIERQKERPALILEFLRPWVSKLSAKNESDWNFLSMSLYTYLYWGQFREILDLTNEPVMKQFLEDFKNCKGIEETKIPT